MLLLPVLATPVCAAVGTQEKFPLADLAATFGATLPGTLSLHNYPL
jgi:hypothetical protein